MSSFMSQFGHFPTKLFRLSATSKTKLRDYTLKKSASYDILTAQGIAQPIASVTYERICKVKMTWKELILNGKNC